MPTPQCLAEHLLATLRRAGVEGRRAALVGYPSHDNIGDHAIWCGQIDLLHQLGCRIVYSADTQEYSPGVLRRRLGPEGVIFFQGGGNFGDLWPEHHELRLRMLDDFAERPIVQMPQTVHFTTESMRERTRATIAGCQQFTLLCRDERSLAIARDDLGATAELTPDAAFGIRMTKSPIGHRPEIDVLWLRRLDDERTTAALERPAGLLDGATVRTVDWPDLAVAGPGPGGRLGSQASWRANQLRATRLTRRAGTGDLAQPLLRRLHDGASRREISAGLDAITGSRVVVTDRLHAHILATLAGIPSVVVDTGYGKIATFIDTFTADLPTTHRAGDAIEAAEIAAALLAGGGRAPGS
jgi:pyruvyl transferase EpsO